LPTQRCGVERNAVVKLERRLDLSPIAGLARLHHGEEGLRQGFGGDVLRLAVRFDQRDRSDVGCRTERGYDGGAFLRRDCSFYYEADARGSAKSNCAPRKSSTMTAGVGRSNRERSPLEAIRRAVIG
jgi:hypothetical protein